MNVKYMSQKSLSERYDVSLRTIQRLVHKLREERPDAVKVVGTRTRVLVTAADEYLLNKKPAPVGAGRGQRTNSKEIIA